MPPSMSIGASEGTVAGKKSKNPRKNGEIKVSSRRTVMWARVRRGILCLPAPDAVCGGGGNGHRIVCAPPQPSAVVLHGDGSCFSEAKEQCEFSSWLKCRGEHDANRGVSIGLSPHGRALFASRPIHTGESMLQVSCDLMITPDKLPEEVSQLLPNNVSAWAKLALFLLAHQHTKEASAWAPYIDCLPPLGALHSTIFWKREELVYLKASATYRETLQRKEVVKTEYAAVQKALLLCPNVFGDRISEREFRHAYAIGINFIVSLILIESLKYALVLGGSKRSRHSLWFLSWIFSTMTLIAGLCYLTTRIGTASRSFPTEITLRETNYGQLTNSTLALDFGFALPYNPYDQAEVWLALSRRDPLFDSKLELLHSHNMPTLISSVGIDTAGNTFSLQAVKSPTGRGKGIPQALRAFARVACASSSQELEEMAKNAADSDGRLARQPSSDKAKELKAMMLLQTLVDNRIQKHVEAEMAIRNSTTLETPRREIAASVIGGELRVLRSASAWLEEHTRTLGQA